jgi:formate--tetrahydrofolate ligase
MTYPRSIPVASHDRRERKPKAIGASAGTCGLARHIENFGKFGVEAVVGINRFGSDTDAEVATLLDLCARAGAAAVTCTHFADGGRGAEALARKVVAILDRPRKSPFRTLYPDDMPLLTKIETIAREIYRAAGVEADPKAKSKLRDYEAKGFSQLLVCIAKTQSSFSSDPANKNAPTGHILPIREVRLSAGAEFVVVICGDIMTMPGLPRVPAAVNIKLDDAGMIVGLS